MKTTQKQQQNSNEITQKTFEIIIKNHPEITADGYGIGTPALTASARKAQYDTSRKDLATFKDAFETSLKWLDRNPDFARNRTSYGLKHEVERTYKGVYVPNGAFILAALHKGLEDRRARPELPEREVQLRSKITSRCQRNRPWRLDAVGEACVSA